MNSVRWGVDRKERGYHLPVVWHDNPAEGLIRFNMTRWNDPRPEVDELPMDKFSSGQQLHHDGIQMAGVGQYFQFGRRLH